VERGAPATAPKKDAVAEPFVEKTATPLPTRGTVTELFVEKSGTPAPVKQPLATVLPNAKAAAIETPLTTYAPGTFNDGPNCHTCRLVVFGDYLYWNVHGGDVPFAQAFDGIIPALSVPRGPVGVVSPQFQSGFRVGGGVDNPDGISIFGTFTYFFTERDAELAAGNGLVLHNFLAFPNTANSAVDSLTSSANYKIRLYLADLDTKCDIVHNESCRLNWLAGVRYAHNDQNVFSTFQVTSTTTVDSKINFDGIGPRFGLEGKYFTRCGLYGYASGIVDVLFGQFRGNYEERNIFTGLVGLTSINANRVVPILEFELGAGWQSPSGAFRVSGGYYVGSWFNMMTTTSFASAIGNTNFTTNGNNFRDSLVFDGFVARFEFRY
jgi:hypothetical protein